MSDPAEARLNGLARRQLTAPTSSATGETQIDNQGFARWLVADQSSQNRQFFTGGCQMKRIGSIGILAVALAFVATPGDAQTTKEKKKSQQMTQSQQIEARHQCFLEAQAAVPGAALGGGEMNQRTAVYMACTARKGVRP